MATLFNTKTSLSYSIYLTYSLSHVYRCHYLRTRFETMASFIKQQSSQSFKNGWDLLSKSKPIISSCGTQIPKYIGAKDDES